MHEYVVLVDEHDTRVGVAEKLEAHKRCLLHRAFSVFVFNARGELLLQRRADTKYHSGGLWSNTCCSHPRSDESISDAARRRLQEEMGFACHIQEVYAFIYSVAFDGGLCEHEYDHVCVGTYDGVVSPDPDEVSAYKWVSLDFLTRDIHEHPAVYTYWFKEIIASGKLSDFFEKS